MKKVKILLKTVTVADGERDENVFTYSGELEEQNGAFYLRYSEITDEAKTNTVIKACDKKVIITRTGAFGSVMKIEEGVTNKTEYKTPYGAFLMAVRGEKYKNDFKQKGTLLAEYTLFNESGVIGKNEIEIKIKEV